MPTRSQLSKFFHQSNLNLLSAGSTEKLPIFLNDQIDLVEVFRLPDTFKSPPDGKIH